MAGVHSDEHAILQKTPRKSMASERRQVQRVNSLAKKD
jgi:hypothetical protein